ncbi:MAG: radical SAM protein [Planctomycetota bacterium]
MTAVPIPESTASPGLFHTRYTSVARNTIDYWMLPDDPSMTVERVERAIENTPALDDASLQLYVHVPFCAQRCRFCAFSGGNSLEFDVAERYSRLLVEQMRHYVGRIAISGRAVRSVHLGGGSPDLLGPHARTVLRGIRDLPGVTDETEIAVEFTASTVTEEFLDTLVEHEVTKASFGVQSVDPRVRRAMRQPPTMRHVEQALRWIDGRIPIVNADLITGMPGQDLSTVNRDLRAMLEEPRIHGISSYLLTSSAAPSLVAAVDSGEVPEPPSPAIQAAMRLHTYSTLQREGWIRRGTNTYLDPSRIAPEVFTRVSGNECIGGGDYESFLLGIGAQAVGNLPGVRVENLVDVNAWCDAVESGAPPWHAAKCATEHQRDTALWVMPLRWEGLPRRRFERMLHAGVLSQRQLRTLEDLTREGLLVETAEGYELSILGEVFMGHLVRDLKSPDARRAVDHYADEGDALGSAIASGALPDANIANDRQRAPRQL